MLNTLTLNVAVPKKAGPTELRIQLDEGSRQTARARKIRALKSSSAAKVRATVEGDVH